MTTLCEFMVALLDNYVRMKEAAQRAHARRMEAITNESEQNEGS